MLKSDKRYPKLTLGAIRQEGEIRFYYNGIKRMFYIDGVPSPSYFIIGNKMRFKRVGDLLDFLFLWEDDKERAG
jgi:hypothetical protein